MECKVRERLGREAMFLPQQSQFHNMWGKKMQTQYIMLF